MTKPEYLTHDNCRNCPPEDSNECLIKMLKTRGRGRIATQVYICMDENAIQLAYGKER